MGPVDNTVTKRLSRLARLRFPRDHNIIHGWWSCSVRLYTRDYHGPVESRSLPRVQTRVQSSSRPLSLHVVHGRDATHLSSPPRFSSTTAAATTTTAVKAYVAFGSNVGDSVGLIEAACDALEAHTAIKLVRTSSLWRTKAMYMEQQASFLNGVVEIETTLSSEALLEALQNIENSLGRRRTVRNGPRTVDLDILLYGSERISTPRLTVPHALMFERGFVLNPLCELIPDDKACTSERTFAQHLAALPSEQREPTVVTPLSSTVFITPSAPDRRTHLMTILNITPDSFSDGGELYGPVTNSTPLSIVDRIEQTTREYLAYRPTLIDIGGQSTRPGATWISPDEELERVLPAIKAVQSALQHYDSDKHDDARAHSDSRVTGESSALISVDTFSAPVAAAALEAGAHVLNDISGGLLDPDILRVAARHRCPLILGHIRGDPTCMNQPPHNVYPSDPPDSVGDAGAGVSVGAGPRQAIAAELAARVNAALEAGVRRWRILLDPGIGFAKGLDVNLAVLRGLDDLRLRGGASASASEHANASADALACARTLAHMPWTLGVSRKGFLGTLTGVSDARDRVHSTAAAVTACVAGGADIVRVHDIGPMRQVVDLADAIYRARMR